MAKLTIRKVPGADPGLCVAWAYEVFLDDRKLDRVQAVSLTLDMGEIPRAVLSMTVDDIEVDADALLALEAIVRARRDEDS